MKQKQTFETMRGNHCNNLQEDMYKTCIPRTQVKKRGVKRHVGLARYKLQVDMSDKLYNIIVSNTMGSKKNNNTAK